MTKGKPDTCVAYGDELRDRQDDDCVGVKP